MTLDEFKQAAKNISSDPYSRVPSHVKPLIERNDVLINCHCHIFNDKAVPKRLFNMKMPYSRKLVAKIINKLHRIISQSNDDKFSNFAYFIDLFRSSTKDITNKLISYYHPDTVFCPLMMDMKPGREQIRKDNYEYYILEQAKDIKQLLDEKYNLLPFLPTDPNNKKVYEIFIKGFTGQYGFFPFGIKVYPPLGYLPSHPKLMEIYKVCEEKNIPVSAHCSRGVTHGYIRRIKNIEGWKINSEGKWTKDPETKWFLSGNAYARYFNHPKNWEKVLEAYPKLKLNLGHFGGEKQWDRLLKGKNNSWISRIMDYFIRYDNFYSDISFTNAYPKLFDLIKSRIESSNIVSERTLYGLDYYMVIVRGHYRSLKVDFDTAMGDNIIKKIGIKNPRRFLFY
jgi:predicted TIM-barrel fold metal-dependent hydrolase